MYKEEKKVLKLVVLVFHNGSESVNKEEKADNEKNVPTVGLVKKIQGPFWAMES